jgi:hypothetical protein
MCLNAAGQIPPFLFFLFLNLVPIICRSSVCLPLGRLLLLNGNYQFRFHYYKVLNAQFGILVI